MFRTTSSQTLISKPPTPSSSSLKTHSAWQILVRVPPSSWQIDDLSSLFCTQSHGHLTQHIICPNLPARRQNCVRVLLCLTATCPFSLQLDCLQSSNIKSTSKRTINILHKFEEYLLVQFTPQSMTYITLIERRVRYRQGLCPWVGSCQLILLPGPVLPGVLLLPI